MDVLTPDQQAKLIAGEWKPFAKQDTGHTRGDATAKIITRALGKPDDQAAFDAAITAWSAQRLPLHAAVEEAENTRAPPRLRHGPEQRKHGPRGQ